MFILDKMVKMKISHDICFLSVQIYYKYIISTKNICANIHIKCHSQTKAIHVYSVKYRPADHHITLFYICRTREYLIDWIHWHKNTIRHNNNKRWKLYVYVSFNTLWIYELLNVGLLKVTWYILNATVWGRRRIDGFLWFVPFKYSLLWANLTHLIRNCILLRG